MKKKNIIISAIMNGTVFLSVLIIVLIQLTIGTTGRYGLKGSQTFRYFTSLSNIWCALVSLIILIYEIMILIGKKKEIPHYAMMLKQSGAVVVMMTLLTVCFYLAPTGGKTWYEAFSSSMFFLHFLDPVLALVSFLFFEKGKGLTWKENFFLLIPTLIYAIVYLIEIQLLGNWPDLYGFTFGRKWWSWLIFIPVMAIVTYLISTFISFIKRKINKKRNEN